MMNWNFEATADHFDVWVSNSHGLLVMRDTNAPGYELQIPSALPRDTYRIWVRAVYADGSNSPWSFPAEFSIH